MRHEDFDLTREVTIQGAPFTFRTFHGRRDHNTPRLDHLETVTLPAIWVKPTMEVKL